MNTINEYQGAKDSAGKAGPKDLEDLYFYFFYIRTYYCFIIYSLYN